MTGRRRSTEQAATELVLEVFRTNGALLAAGDRLAADVGLTSARWQVLGAVELNGSPLTAAQIARRMGMTRQSVHETLRRLQDDDQVRPLDNPDHRRSPLFDLTASGRRAYQEVDRRRSEWAVAFASGIRIDDLITTTDVLRTIAQRVDQQTDTTERT